DNVRRAAGEVGVLDLALGSGSAGEWQDAARIDQHGVPVLLVARIHPGTEDVRVDVADDIVRDPALALAPTTGPRSRTAAAAGAREAVSRGGRRSSVPPVRRERSLGTSPRAARSGRRPPRASLAAPSGRRRPGAQGRRSPKPGAPARVGSAAPSGSGPAACEDGSA